MSGPLQWRTGQNSYLLLATWDVQNACMSSVEIHTHTHTELQLFCTQTDSQTLSSGSFDMSSIHCPEVMEHQSVACVFVAGSYLMGDTGLFFSGW